MRKRSDVLLFERMCVTVSDFVVVVYIYIYVVLKIIQRVSLKVRTENILTLPVLNV